MIRYSQLAGHQKLTLGSAIEAKMGEFSNADGAVYAPRPAEARDDLVRHVFVAMGWATLGVQGQWVITDEDFASYLRARGQVWLGPENPHTGYKIAQALKMWWMFTWRALLFSMVVLRGGGLPVLLVISVVVPILLAFVFKKSISILPIYCLLIARKNPILDIEDGPESRKTKPREESLSAWAQKWLSYAYAKQRGEEVYAPFAPQPEYESLGSRYRHGLDRFQNLVGQDARERRRSRSTVPEPTAEGEESETSSTPRPLEPGSWPILFTSYDDGVFTDLGRRATSATIIPAATRNGRMTGYEPSAIKQHRSRASKSNPKRHGKPGEGLEYAVEMDEKRRALGARGEQNFALALDLNGLMERFHTVWSIPVPKVAEREFNGELVPGEYETDIDCAIATDDALYLVDLKNYASGDVIYFERDGLLHCQDIATGNQVGTPKSMSRNMELATSAIEENFPNLEVRPCVVFMPTDKGEARIESVRWPGGIRALTLSDFLTHIAEQASDTETSISVQVALELAKLANRENKRKQMEAWRDKSVEDMIWDGVRFGTLLDEESQ